MDVLVATTLIMFCSLFAVLVIPWPADWRGTKARAQIRRDTRKTRAGGR